MKAYQHVVKGRSFYSVFVTGFVSCLAFAFLVCGDIFFALCGIALLFLAGSGVYAIAKGEIWVLRIDEGVLTWCYDRWPQSSGQIDLRIVQSVIVDDCSARVSFRFGDGTTRTIKLVGHGYCLRDYLLQHFPTVQVTFIDGT